jgi:hypothetical protein
METTAADLGESGWDQYYGYGCVDYDAALEELDGGSEDPEGMRMRAKRPIRRLRSSRSTAATA